MSRPKRRGVSAARAAITSRIEAPARGDIDIWGLPRGVHKLDAGEIAGSQRARLFYAIVHAVAKKGYAATTVTDICALARLSKSTFYGQFKDKEDCFLASYEAAHHELVAAVVGGQDLDAGWAPRMRDSLRAYLAYNRDNPRVARAFLVEIHAAGARAWDKRDWGHEAFARMQKALYQVRRAAEPRLPELPDEIFLAVVAAIEEMVCSYVRKGRTHEVMALEPRALYLVEAIYSGHPAALAALRARPGS